MGYKYEGSWKALKILGVIFALLLVAGGVALFVVYQVPKIRLSNMEAHYKDSLQRLFDRTQSVVNGKHEELSSARRPAKALWIVARTKPFANWQWDLHVDERILKLPESMRPDGPDDVHSVVIVFSTSEKTGQYVTRERDGSAGNAVDAYVQKADVVVVDLDHNAVLAQKHFQAEQRKHIILVASSPVAQLDDAEILDWYLNLPEQ